VAACLQQPQRPWIEDRGTLLEQLVLGKRPLKAFINEALTFFPSPEPGSMLRWAA
jgi:hypothetical protein